MTKAPAKARTLSLAAITMVALGALTGCGSLGVQSEWDARPSYPSLEPVYVEIPASELQRTCGRYPGMALYGCARRDFEMRACFIYTAPQPATWLLEHERKHCAGYDHGPPPTVVS